MLLPRVAALASLATMLMTSAPAHAYELHRTPDGHATHWAQPRVVFSLSQAARARLGGEDLIRATVIATEAWRGLPGSPDLVLSSSDGADLTGPALDGVNRIYVSNALLAGDHLAETRLSFEPRTGRILDADIVVSGATDWEVMVEGEEERSAYDLGAVLTHEMGHALGLSDEPDVHGATMFPRFRRGDTRARTPEVDDERGVLAAYRDHPADAALSTGCSAGGAEAPWFSLTLALGLLALRHRRRPQRVRA